MKKQRGSISLLGILSIVSGLSGFYMVMELGNKMIMDRNFDHYAQAIAPVALRTEMALTKAMVEAGDGDMVQTKVSELLAQLEHTVGGDVTVNIQFGNMVPLDAAATYTDPDTGMEYSYSEEFVPLEQNAGNPKSGLADGEMPPDFSAVSIEIVESNPNGLLKNFHPQGRAIYGLSASDLESPDMANCFCDTRYNSCLVAPKAHDVMGDPDSGDRKRYCETGYAPSVGGGMMGMFFGGDAKYDQADTVKFSPQWVGKPYEGETVQTDQESDAWVAVENDETLDVNSGDNPFPEAGWDAANAAWLLPGENMDYEETSCSLFGGCSTTTENVDGLFYVGRSGVCAYPSTGFFGGMMSVITDFMSGNTDCIRYSADPDLKYKFASPIESFMNAINGSTGANEHYYSCRDFSGIQSSRSGFFQIMRRMWTSPLQDWTRSYQESDCTVKKMHWHGWWMFGEWRES